MCAKNVLKYALPISAAGTITIEPNVPAFLASKIQFACLGTQITMSGLPGGSNQIVWTDVSPLILENIYISQGMTFVLNGPGTVLIYAADK